MVGTHMMAPRFGAATDARVVAALAARKQLDAAMMNGDFNAVEAIFAPDLVVHSPINAVVDRDNVMARLRSGRIKYEPNVEVRFEFVGVRGGSVVLMGEEIVRPVGAAPFAGTTVHRRFTDIWTRTREKWQLAIRQATITPAQ
jgi:ketosteroid isomerase-like protein